MLVTRRSNLRVLPSRTVSHDTRPCFRRAQRPTTLRERRPSLIVNGNQPAFAVAADDVTAEQLSRLGVLQRFECRAVAFFGEQRCERLADPAREGARRARRFQPPAHRREAEGQARKDQIFETGDMEIPPGDLPADVYLARAGVLREHKEERAQLRRAA